MTLFFKKPSTDNYGDARMDRSGTTVSDYFVPDCPVLLDGNSAGGGGWMRRDSQIKEKRESDDNYPLDLCPAPVVNQCGPLGNRRRLSLATLTDIPPPWATRPMRDWPR